jgi:hypothetical protein
MLMWAFSLEKEANIQKIFFSKNSATNGDKTVLME